MKSILENVLGGLSNSYVPIQIIYAKEYLIRISRENKKMERVTKVMDPGGGLKTLHPLLCSISQVLGL